MALDTALFLAQELLKLNTFFLLGLVVAFAFLAYKLFGLLLRVMLTGVAFGAFPVIANFAGIGIPLTVETILWSALTGIMIYFAYLGISFGYKIINAAFFPFRRMYRKRSQRPRRRDDD